MWREMVDISPADYARQHPVRTGGRECWLCQIPQRELMDKARREDGLSLDQIRGYLIDVLGYSPDLATVHRVKGHFVNGRHHERAE
jgi:hypothetical protein